MEIGMPRQYLTGLSLALLFPLKAELGKLWTKWNPNWLPAHKMFDSQCSENCIVYAAIFVIDKRRERRHFHGNY